jgi:hypothetical protein
VRLTLSRALYVGPDNPVPQTRMLAISATILNPLIENYIKTNPVMQHGLAATKDAKNPYKTNALNPTLPAFQGIRHTQCPDFTCR